jgi:catechol 2,3-dioxygenase-like lactoylglutathione lyase family enzyme
VPSHPPPDPVPAHTLFDAGLARVSHLSVQVAELDATEQWWTRHFGFQPILRRDLGGPEFDAVTGVAGATSRMLRGLVAGTVLQFFQHSWRAFTPPNVLVSFEVRDAGHAYARLTEAGVACTSAPVEFDNSWAFTAADPDGLPIELIQWKPPVEPYTAR